MIEDPPAEVQKMFDVVDYPNSCPSSNDLTWVDWVKLRGAFSYDEWDPYENPGLKDKSLMPIRLPEYISEN